MKSPMSVLGIWCLAFRLHGLAQLRAHGSEFGALGLESGFCFGSAPGSRFQSQRSGSRILSLALVTGVCQQMIIVSNSMPVRVPK